MKYTFGRTALRYGCIAALALSLSAALTACGSSGGSSSAKSPTGGASATVDASGKRAVVKESAVATFENGLKQAKTNPQGAISAFKSAIDEESSFAEAWYNIGVLEQQQGHLSEANKAYDKAIELRPDMPEPYNNQAKMLIDEGKVDEAEQMLLRIVDDKGVAPYNVQANLNLGMIYRQKGEAVLEKERGGTEPKFSMEGAEKKGEIKNKEAYDLFAKAVVYIRRALAGDSNNIYCYENLAAIYYLLNSLEVARLVSDQAVIKYSEYNEELQKQLSAGRITQEEYDKKVYSPKDLSAIYNTSGLIYLAEGEVSLGNDAFKKAVEADPNNVQAMLNVAGIAVNVQDYRLAYDIYNKVLALQPDNVEAYLSKGVAARGLNNTDEAEKIYRDIMSKHPDYPQARFNLIVLYQEYYLKLDEARQMWVDFTNDSKANELIPGRVAEARERIKQIDEAKEAQKAADAKAAALQKKMEELERLQQEMEAAGGGDAAPAE